MTGIMSKTALAGLAMAALFAAQPANAKICLRLREISSTDANKDGTAINFKMLNGKVWRNDLKGKCPDLRFDGFVWQINQPADVCEDGQTLHVIRSSEVCTLGKFTDVTPAKKG